MTGGQLAGEWVPFDGDSVNTFLATAPTRVMRASVPIPALVSDVVL